MATAIKYSGTVITGFMTQLLYIAAGGALGAVLRYLVSTGVHFWLGRGFPYGTLAVNLSGSFLMGFLYIFLLERITADENWRAGIIIGLLGAFTTFSTFSMETLNLIESGEELKAGMNILLSVTLCVLGCWLGVIIARQI